jgi:hypothetical protein
LGIGTALRAERERRHVSLDAVARGTLVRFDFLELIDQERFDELPSGAYAKGFLRSYATYLGLDPKPYIRSYEERYAQPAPELSSVVQKGVRVPPAAQRRAWKVAIGGAGSLIVVLGLLGAFRSGEEPAEAPAVSAAAARIAASAAPNAMGAVVQVEVVGASTWIEANADGQETFGAVLGTGESRTFKANDRLVLYVARARSVRIIANGRDLQTPQTASYRGVFTPDTMQLPPHEPAAAALGAPLKRTSTPPGGQANAVTGGSKP